jgi:hypothetical protein
VSATKPNPKRSSRSAVKAGVRSAKSATTQHAGNATSVSAEKSSSCCGELTTGSAGAVENGRPLFSTTSTGQRISIRGVLCPNCNRGLGLLGDSLEGVQKALQYLHRYEARKTSTQTATAEAGQKEGEKERGALLGLLAVCNG